MTDIQAATIVDARGMQCPMPISLANRAIRALQPGELIKVLSTDKGSVKDFPAWAEDTGNELVSTTQEDGAFVFYIRRGTDDDI